MTSEQQCKVDTPLRAELSDNDDLSFIAEAEPYVSS
jgi:hypothetical protein